jgi:dTDP-glucose 4,6-dehydratase
MKWCIFGSKGWIGSYLKELLISKGETVLEINQHFTSFKELQETVKNSEADRIICAVGRTYGGGIPTIDYLEQPGKLTENLESNLQIPVWIAQAAPKTPILYFGTGCIYEYTKDRAVFTEEDDPNFTGSAYSTVKRITDKIMGAFPNVMNARIRMPISDSYHPRDFITKLLNYSKITSIANSMTVLSDILPLLVAALEDGTLFGTINAVNPNAVDHEWILKNHQEITGHVHTYTLEPVEEQSKRLLSRRSNNTLDATKLQNWLELLPDELCQKYNLNFQIPLLQDSLLNILKGRANKQSRRLLVTGGCGFLGSQFINMWMSKYPLDTLLNVDRLDPCASVENIQNRTSSRYTLVVADIANMGLMLNLMNQFEITHVVHFAAQTHVDHSFGNSLSFTESNLVGTHSLLEAARSYGKLKRFLHMSTDEVYGEIKEGSFCEKSLLQPTNPYAATKAGAEFLVRSYGHSFKLPYVIVRGNNIYGPQQYPEKVIPAFAMAVLQGKPMRIQGQGTAVRMFVHVEDVVDGVELVLLKGEDAEIYNIGSRDQYSVMEIAERVLKHYEPTKCLNPCIQFIEDRPFNDCRYSVNTQKIEQLGWSCKIPFSKGLASTLEWYKMNQKRFMLA